MDADRARSAPPRRDQDDAVRRVRAVQRRRRRPAPLPGGQGDGALETRPTAAVLLRRQDRGPAAEQRPGDERQPRLRHSRKRARPRGPGKRGPAGWRAGPVRRYRARGATMTSFFKTSETYRQGARTLPGRYYTSPEIFAEEVERIFARRWVCVGRAAELSEPGDYFLADVAGESLIMLRDQGGTLRAHYNVCRHRGTRLCEERRGRLSETIQCPYHAWTYTLDGQLIGAPHMSEVEGFHKRDYPLHAPALAEWEGFLVINLAPDPEPFAQAFAPLIGRFARFNIANLRSARRIDYDVRANWKLIFQNYSECLHCPVIHPELAKLAPYTSGENDLVDGPFLGGYMTITREGGSLTLSGRACGPGPYSPRESVPAAWDREFLRAIGHAG